MASKRTQTADKKTSSETIATPSTPADHGDPQVTPAKEPKNKGEAVKWVLKEGETSPKKVVKRVKQDYGMDVTQSYVSVIKSQMKKSKSAKKPGRKPGRKPKTQEANESPAPANHKVQPSAGLTPEDLASLAELAEKAGGLDRLQDFLHALKRLK
jgi:hypothetical protein